MRRRLLLLVSVVVCVFFGLATPALSQALPSHYGQDALPPLSDPARTLVLIFNHGSVQEFVSDSCEMNKYNAPYGVPAVVHDLYGQEIGGLKVLVDGYCTPTRRGYYDMNTRSGDPKVMLRSIDIEARAKSFIAAGVPVRQIFLVGHSAGGWAALMAKQRNPQIANSVIAFAPAFAGQRGNRKPGWQWLHEQYVAQMQTAPRLDALVFAIQNDAFETPETLQFLDSIPGVTRVVLSDMKIGQVACDSKTSSHALVRNVCFTQTQGSVMKTYIETRLAAAAN
jgi:pimeloyl-ACP methyl ester carboxylesterase